MRALGPIRALVFGNYAEVSPDVEDLLERAAQELARRRWAVMGAHNEAEARSYFISTLRRKLGLVVMREMARHRLNRVQYVGVRRAALASRASTRPASSEPLSHHGEFAAWQAPQLDVPPAVAAPAQAVARPRGGGGG